MSDETTLLPCICGGKAETWDGAGPWHVVCTKCGTVGSPCLTEAEAIAAWNTRADYHGYEQAAIEAWKSIKTWNTRATHGTLTAEQVREAIEANSWAETSSVREFNDSSWQAIADELNARAERTCEPTEEWCCDHCGADLIECNVGVAAGGGAYELDPPILVNYCPNCGAKVRNE